MVLSLTTDSSPVPLRGATPGPLLPHGNGRYPFGFKPNRHLRAAKCQYNSLFEALWHRFVVPCVRFTTRVPRAMQRLLSFLSLLQGFACAKRLQLINGNRVTATIRQGTPAATRATPTAASTSFAHIGETPSALARMSVNAGFPAPPPAERIVSGKPPPRFSISR